MPTGNACNTCGAETVRPLMDCAFLMAEVHIAAPSRRNRQARAEKRVASVNMQLALTTPHKRVSPIKINATRSMSDPVLVKEPKRSLSRNFEGGTMALLNCE